MRLLSIASPSVIVLFSSNQHESDVLFMQDYFLGIAQEFLFTKTFSNGCTL